MEQNRTDYEIYISLLQKANIKHVATKGNFPDTLDDNLYIAAYASFDGSTIVVHEFKESGELIDIYIADGCSSLEEFLNYETQ